MTDGPDWAETLAAIKKPPGKSNVGNTRPGMDQVQVWQEFQQQRTGADVAVALGGVDTGDDYDGWAHVTEFAHGVVDGIADGASNFGNLVEGIFEALTGNSGAQSYVDPVQQLQYLAGTVSGHSQAISELQAANGGSENGGVVGGDTFETPYSGSMGPGWALYSTDGDTSYLGTVNGKLEWTNKGNATPLVTAQRIDPKDAKTLTEFQKISVVVTTPTAGTGAENRIYGRMSPDRQHYVVAYVKDDTIYIAYKAGASTTETVVDSGPMPNGLTLSTGRQLNLECGTDELQNEYRVTIGGVNGQSWTDSTNLATSSMNFAARGLSESPKGWMLGFKGQWNAPFPWSTWYGYPAALANVTVTDNIPVAIQGHGFRVYREATGNSASFAQLTKLAQYYDTIDYISPGSAWASTGYTIPKDGMWSFSWRVYRSGNTWTHLVLGLAVNGSGKTAGGVWLNTNIAQDTVQYYCKKGDVVDIYVANVAGTAQMTGSSSGVDSYFSGALMSS